MLRGVFAISRAAQGAQAVIGLAGLVAGRRAQAGMEAVWEVPRGVACIAEGTWPPNPAAIVAGSLHFEAAAQYAMMAGKSAHRPGTSEGAGTYGSSRSDYARGGGRAGLSPPDTTVLERTQIPTSSWAQFLG